MIGKPKTLRVVLYFFSFRKRWIFVARALKILQSCQSKPWAGHRVVRLSKIKALGVVKFILCRKINKRICHDNQKVKAKNFCFIHYHPKCDNYVNFPNHSKTGPFKIWTFLSGFQMVSDEMAHLSGFQMVGVPYFWSHWKSGPFATQPL